MEKIKSMCCGITMHEEEGTGELFCPACLKYDKVFDDERENIKQIKSDLKSTILEKLPEIGIEGTEEATTYEEDKAFEMGEISYRKRVQSLINSL